MFTSNEIRFRTYDFSLCGFESATLIEGLIFAVRKYPKIFVFSGDLISRFKDLQKLRVWGLNFAV